MKGEKSVFSPKAKALGFPHAKILMSTWHKSGNYSSIQDLLVTKSGLTIDEITKPKSIPPNSINNIAKAADVIFEKMHAGCPITIIGDYDADGITSTAILYKLLSHFGVTPTTIIPRRFTDGYGVSISHIEGLKNSLIITVDNGITAVEPIKKAKEQGNTVIILDHHLASETLPEADVIVDPHIPGDTSVFKEYCSAGLSYKLAQYMCKNDISKDTPRLIQDLNVLAMIGTLADVMPLRGDNRKIVIDGLSIINNHMQKTKLSFACDY